VPRVTPAPVTATQASVSGAGVPVRPTDRGASTTGTADVAAGTSPSVQTVGFGDTVSHLSPIVKRSPQPAAFVADSRRHRGFSSGYVPRPLGVRSGSSGSNGHDASNGAQSHTADAVAPQLGGTESSWRGDHALEGPADRVGAAGSGAASGPGSGSGSGIGSGSGSGAVVAVSSGAYAGTGAAVGVGASTNGTVSGGSSSVTVGVVGGGRSPLLSPSFVSSPPPLSSGTAAAPSAPSDHVLAAIAAARQAAEKVRAATELAQGHVSSLQRPPSSLGAHAVATSPPPVAS
jgi:hypothetical protein